MLYDGAVESADVWAPISVREKSRHFGLIFRRIWFLNFSRLGEQASSRRIETRLLTGSWRLMMMRQGIDARLLLLFAKTTSLASDRPLRNSGSSLRRRGERRRRRRSKRCVRTDTVVIVLLLRMRLWRTLTR